MRINALKVRSPPLVGRWSPFDRFRRERAGFTSVWCLRGHSMGRHDQMNQIRTY